jgi:hypothetical protein
VARRRGREPSLVEEEEEEEVEVEKQEEGRRVVRSAWMANMWWGR